VKLAFLALFLVAIAQQPSIDRGKLEAIRRMSPEERTKLKGRLEQIKKLPPEERERLRENLKKVASMSVEEVKKAREKSRNLTPEDRRDFSDLASGFFRWAHHRGYGKGFPRAMFFQWLKSKKPGKIEEIRALESGVGSPRVDEFVKLYYEFRDVTLVRVEEHIRRHKCMDGEAAHELRDTSPKEFWPRWQDLLRECSGKRANPGPTRDLPQK
jgi:hypothetical protein